MKKNPIKKFQIFSIIFTFIIGTLLHFTYNWSGNNSIVGLFSAVNESTWEHLKLLFFPMLLTTIIGYFYFKDIIPNFLCSKMLGILISMCGMIIFFYTYTGVLGKNIAIIDISSFFIFTILGEVVAYLLIINRYSCNKKTAIITLLIITVLFAIFTFYPPKIGLFKDPVTENYGLFKT